MTGIAGDLREALRRMRTEWRFTLTVVLTFAVGIGGTGAMFSVVNNALLRPLPFKAEDRLVRVRGYQIGPDGTRLVFSNWPRSFYALRDGSSSFDAAGAVRGAELTLDEQGDAAPATVQTAFVSPGMMALMGVPPVAGRLFSDEEERLGTDAGVAIIGYGLWQRRYGGDPSTVGSAIRIDGRPCVVVGVMPQGFAFPYGTGLWTPERIAEDAPVSVMTMARLAPGVTLESARAELDAIADRVGEKYPDTRQRRIQIEPLRTSILGDDAEVTMLLTAGVVLLLVLACANVANLLLARGVRRQREHAVRAALGASRARQTRTALVESLVLAAAGTAAGLVLARLAGSVAMDLVPAVLRDELGMGDMAFDWRAAVFVAAVTTVTGVLAGLLPALRAGRADVVGALRAETRGSTGSHRLMSAIVAGEVALAALLLFGAGLLVDHLRVLLDRDLGLRPAELVTVEVVVPPSRYASAEARVSLATRLREAVQSAPGVVSASFASINPLALGNWGAGVEVDGHPLPPGSSPPLVNHRLVGPGFFETTGIPIRRGRGFTDTDTPGGAPVVVISARMAERFWPGEDPLGRRVRSARPDAPWLTIVGIAGDVEDWGEWRETWYLPHAQHAATAAGDRLHLMVRSPLDEAALGRAIRDAVSSVDATLPVPPPTPMRALYESTLERERLGTSAASLFGASGLLLAAIGLYGLLAYAVSERARELGIRLALGATPGQVTRHVLGRAGVLVGTGLAAAGVGGWWLASALGAAVTGMDGSVPASVPLMVGGVLTATAAIAVAVPARRATTIDPMTVMRSE
ncbi:MAG: ABC transporter permease [Vicinamibacterales bacterium]